MWYQCTLLFLGVLFFSHGETRSPVVIVPGTGGNQLEAKLVGKPTTPAWYCYSKTKSWFTLWLSIQSLLPFKINCWVDNMRLEWNMDDLTVVNSPGVITRVPGFGFTETMRALDSGGLVSYMRELLNYLVKIGYTEGKDLHGAPYEFRYAPEHLPYEYHTKLRELIENTYSANDNISVTIISHSYGCVVTQYFLTLQSKGWKEKYLKQWVPIAGVFGGTKQEVMLYSSGYLEHVPSVIIDRLKLRGEQRSSTSNLWMLPHAPVWSKDDVMVKTRERSYKLSDMDAFLVDIGFPEGAIMRHHISNATHLMSIAPNVPIHCFYGVIEDSTIERLEFQDDFPDNPSKVINGPGDGTVNYDSLQLCKSFSELQEEEVTVTEVPGVSHTDIVHDQTVLNGLKELL